MKALSVSLLAVTILGFHSSALALCGIPHVRIAVLDLSRTGEANLGDGVYAEALRRALEAAEHVDNLEPNATSVHFGVDALSELSDLAPAPGGWSLVILHNRYERGASMPTPLGPEEQEALRRYVEEGGAVLIAVDDGGGDTAARESAAALLAPFGLELASTAPSCVERVAVATPEGHLVTDGPFGRVEELLFAGGARLRDLGPHAEALVEHPETGEAVLAYLDRDALAPGSGRVVVATDTGWLLDDDADPTFHFSRHEALFFNAATWLYDACIPRVLVTREISAPLEGGEVFQPGDRVEVRLHIEPGFLERGECDETDALTLVERIPEGWSPELEDGELFLAPNGNAFVGVPSAPAFEPYTVSYSLVAESEQERAELLGRVTVDFPTAGRCISRYPASALVRGDTEARPPGTEPLRVAVLDASRHDSLSLDEGIHFARARGALRAQASELGFSRVDLVALPTLSPAGLEGAHVVWLHNRSGKDCPGRVRLSAEEQTALRRFVENGGAALILADGEVDPAASLLAPFDVIEAAEGTDESSAVHPIPDPTAHPITAGPFGVVESLTVTRPGRISDLGPHARSLLATGDDDGSLLAVIDSGALAGDSGRVVIVGDANWLGTLSSEEEWHFAEPAHRALLLNTIAWLLAPNASVAFRRGDCNDDGSVDIADAIFALRSLFLGGEAPRCDDACDSNDDGSVDVSDAVATLGALFLGQSPIPPPGSQTCGEDPSPDTLACEIAPECP